MEVAIVAVTILSIAIVEAVAYLIYKVSKMNKELNRVITNIDGLSECMLEMAKRMPSIDVIEEEKTNSSDFDFPGV